MLLLFVAAKITRLAWLGAKDANKIVKLVHTHMRC